MPRSLLCCERHNIQRHLPTPSQGWVAAEQAHCHMTQLIMCTWLMQHTPFDIDSHCSQAEIKRLCLSQTTNTAASLLVYNAPPISKINKFTQVSSYPGRIVKRKTLNHLQVDNNGRSNSNNAPRRTTTWTKTKSD